MESKWFTGSADVTSFTLEELMGTKLRALYQRKKGRDLFDLRTALGQDNVHPDHVLSCFQRCMREGGHAATRAQFEENLAAKRTDPRFANDIEPLISAGTDWNLDAATDSVLRKLISRLPGDPWRGPGRERGDELHFNGERLTWRTDI